MKRTIFIFHGTRGNPSENWFPWLKKELEKDGHKVIVPQFPPPPNEALENWLKVLHKYKQHINKDTIFIGHSRGGRFLLLLLERLKTPAFATFLVGTAVGIKPYLFYDDAYNFANGYNFDWKKIRSNSLRFYVYHSDNDPYVCLENGKAVAKEVGTKLILIPNAGHFNTISGYTKFEKLLEDIKNIINKIL